MHIDIIFENDDFVAINKPSGLLSIPDRIGKEFSLKDYLKERYGNIYTVHRLDKGTSGIILFAKTEEAHKELSLLFEGREMEKYYIGLVNGQMIHTKGTIDAAIMEHPGKTTKMITHVKGKASITDYDVLESFRLFSWVQFQIHTGRTHQIRAHMKYIGHTLFNDATYGGDKVLRGDLFSKYKQFVENCFEIIPRQALHAKSLGFVHPTTKEWMQFDSELPEDFTKVLEKWDHYLQFK